MTSLPHETCALDPCRVARSTFCARAAACCRRPAGGSGGRCVRCPAVRPAGARRASAGRRAGARRAARGGAKGLRRYGCRLRLRDGARGPHPGQPGRAGGARRPGPWHRRSRQALRAGAGRTGARSRPAPPGRGGKGRRSLVGDRQGAARRGRGRGRGCAQRAARSRDDATAASGRRRRHAARPVALARGRSGQCGDDALAHRRDGRRPRPLRRLRAPGMARDSHPLPQRPAG